MTRKTLFAGIVVAGVIAGSAPALASPDSHLCLAATHDKNNPGPSVVCVWLPGDAGDR